MLELLSPPYQLEETIALFLRLLRSQVLVAILVSLEDLIERLLNCDQLIRLFKWRIIKGKFTSFICEVVTLIVLIIVLVLIFSLHQSFPRVLEHIGWILIESVFILIRLVILITFDTLGKVLLIFFEIFEPLFIDLLCEARHLRDDLWQLLLHDWRQILRGGLDDAEQPEDYASDFKL